MKISRPATLGRWLFFLGCVSVAVLPASDRTPSLSPEAALAAFRLAPGLRIELVAAEPLIVAPVAFAFDDERRLFVVEGRSYPGPSEGAPPVAEGRVALLTDRDGDGRYDHRTEFATGLTFPNGIAVWRGGVFVTCAPDIWYLKDTDGDGIADEKRVVLTGFDVTRTPQLRVSHPTLGLDGKIYFTCGLNSGTVTSPAHPERAAEPFKLSDGRFDPDSLTYETTGGRGQFGLTFDSFGRRFVCSNRHPVLQVVLEPAHLQRNPHLAFADTMQAVSKIEAEATVWPISRASVSADFIPALMSKPHTGTFTAASGVLFFGGTALGPDAIGDFFIAESAQNLVQRQKVSPAGAAFQSAAAEPGREFLASTDVRFRPVFLADGPDGALYVADMHRREIDHPAFLPEEARGRLDFEGGKDRGRIYRVVRAALSRPSSPSLARDPAELVRGLHSPDEWWRARAQRLLVEQRALSAVPTLAQAAAAAPLAATRVRALWTLRALGALSPERVRAALRDPVAGVREQAVAFVADQNAASAGLAESLVGLAGDDDARVRFVTALALGSWPDARAVAPLAAIAARDGQDRWVRAAVLSGVGRRLEAFLRAFALHQTESPAAVGAVMEDLGRLIGAGETEQAGRLFLREILAADPAALWRIPAALGLAEGLRGRANFKMRTPGAPLAALLAEPDAAATALRALFQRAAATALNESASLAQRSAAVALLGHTDYTTGAAGLGDLLAARQPPELQLQAVRAFERVGDPRGGELLVQPSRWSGYTPQIRGAVVATLLAKPVLVPVLLAAIKRGEIQPAEVPSVRRAALLKHSDPALRAQATALFKSLEGGDRMAVYQTYREVLGQPADAAAGAAVYARACSACHTFQNTGGKVGPDLTGFRNQPAEALLLHILVPNYEVAPGYQAMSVATRDGRALSGWLAAETSGSLTLRTAFGTEETVLRESIATLTASGVSLMPDGLEQTMTKPELAALIAYLKKPPAESGP